MYTIQEFNADFSKLFEGLDNIFSSQNLTVATMLQLYTLVYDLSSIGSIERILQNINIPRQKYFISVLQKPDGTHLGVGEVYYRMQNYLIEYVKKLYKRSETLTEDELVRWYINKWTDYSRPIKLLNIIFRYLSRYLMGFAQRDGYDAVHDINTLVILTWYKYMLKPIFNRLLNSGLKIIEIERTTHDITNASFVNDMIDSFKEFHFDKNIHVWFEDEAEIISPIPMNFYKDSFENSFFEQTKRFYQIEANKYADEPLIIYLKITKYYNEEKHRIQRYLPSQSTQTVLTMIEQIFIGNRLDEIYDTVKDMLNRKNYEDLKDLYQMIKQFSITKMTLKDLIRDHIFEAGRLAIENSETYVTTIIDIHSKFSQFIQDTFLNDELAVGAFNEACAKCIALPISGKISSQILAQFCHLILRKRKNFSLTELEFNVHVDEIMIVFNYIENKDVFESLYRRLLSKRLIHNESISLDYEEVIISKFKQTCDSAYTSKMEKMLQDIRINNELHNQKELPFEFSGMVLASNVWSLSGSMDCVLPEQLNCVYDQFIKFYLLKHKDRKLTLVPQHSIGELELETRPTKQRYNLKVSTYQMAILLLFNQSIQWTVDEIENHTKMNHERIRSILVNLVKFKLLIYNENDSTVRLAEDFRKKRIRVDLTLMSKNIEQKDNENLRTINDERKYLIQATIIRIMKMRKILKYSLLIQEVIEQLKSRFKPEISMIKKCVDLLLEKDYLERDENEKETLHYKA